MKLTKEQLTNIALGTAYITEEEKGVHFHRFTKEQENYYKETNNNFYLKALGTAGVKLSFKTDSKALFIKGTTTEHPSRKYYSLDVEKDGKIIGSINNFEGAELASPYTVSELQTGDFSKSFELGEGEKNICVYMPWTAITYISEFSLDDGASLIPLKPSKTLIAFGDSITQGYDALYSSNRYAGVLSTLLDAEEYNKAIGAEKFPPTLAKLRDSFSPDYITVAYGTNDWGGDRKMFEENCTAFYKNLSENYPNAKIFAITPIWRSDFEDVRPFGPFSDIAEFIEKTVSSLPNVFCIHGFDFVPKSSEYYADFRLHPNDKGFEFYANNLYNEIKKHL